MRPTTTSWSVYALLAALLVAPLDGAQIGGTKPAAPKQVAADRNSGAARELSLESLLGKLKLPGGPAKEPASKKNLHDELLGVVLGEGEREDSTSTVQLAARLGFKYELHYSHSPDGYTTQLVRLVNPHIKRSLLRKVPVVLYAGQGTSPAAFLVGALELDASAATNKSSTAYNWHPGSYAELADAHLVGDVHEQVASSGANRSLAVMLSNSGFDVWLVPARGVDAPNRARTSARGRCGARSEAPAAVKDKGRLSRRSLDPKEVKLMKKLEVAKQLEVDIKEKNKPKFSEPSKSLPDLASIDLSDMKVDLLEKLRGVLRSSAAKSYWSFSNDEIIEKELQCQLELVRSVSGTEKLSLVSYSNGGFVSFGFMARQSAWSRQHLDTAIALAPAVFVNKFNVALNLAGFASQVSLFDAPFPEDQLGALGKKLCLQEPIRSGACRALIEQLYGQSESLASGGACLNYALEHYLIRARSAQALRQVLQVAHAGKMQQYDQGLLGNLIAYKQHKPPSYALDQVYHERLYVVSGEQDAFVDQSSLVLLMGSIGCKPEAWLKCQQYNHLDLLLGRDVDREVNLPVTNILLDRDIELDYYREGDEEEEAEARGAKGESAKQHNESEPHDDNNKDGEHELGQHGETYEGHTTSHGESKSYDVEGHEEADPLVEQSALRPVKVAATATAAATGNSSANNVAPPTQQSRRQARM